MNHLAHALLAAHDDRAIVGALLSDVVKGDVPGHWGPAVAAEVRLHPLVDDLTEAHTPVRAAVAAFEPSRRRFAGIALDVHFDHLLARDWARHGDGGSLEDFSERVTAAIERFDGPLPAPLVVLGERWRRHGGLLHYRDEDSVRFAIDRLAGRLSRGGDRLQGTVADLAARPGEMSQAFEALWPDLRRWVAATRAGLLRTAP